MGIEGLLPLFKPIMQVARIEIFENKTCVVDAMSWLYRACYGIAQDLGQGKPNNDYLVYIHKMVSLLKRYKIKPILVFDGKHIYAKKQTEQSRKKNKQDNKEQADKLLEEGKQEEAKKYYQRCIKITKDMIYTTIESDAQIAFLCKNGYADFAISEDSDLIVYGCEKIVYKLNVNGDCQYLNLQNLRADKQARSGIKSVQLRQLLSFNQDQFVYSCILAGCDYLPSIKGMGIKKAIQFFDKLGKLETVVKRLQNEKAFVNKVPQNYLKTIIKISYIFLYQRVYDPLKKQFSNVNLLPSNFSYENNLSIGEEFENVIEFVQGLRDIKRLDSRQPKQYDFKEILLVKNIQNTQKDTINNQQLAFIKYQPSEQYQQKKQKRVYSITNNSANKQQQITQNIGQNLDKINNQEEDEFLDDQQEDYQNLQFDDDQYLDSENDDDEEQKNDKENQIFTQNKTQQNNFTVIQEIDYLQEICQQLEQEYQTYKNKNEQKKVVFQNNDQSLDINNNLFQKSNFNQSSNELGQQEERKLNENNLELPKNPFLQQSNSQLLQLPQQINIIIQNTEIQQQQLLQYNEEQVVVDSLKVFNIQSKKSPAKSPQRININSPQRLPPIPNTQNSPNNYTNIKQAFSKSTMQQTIQSKSPIASSRLPFNKSPLSNKILNGGDLEELLNEDDNKNKQFLNIPNNPFLQQQHKKQIQINNQQSIEYLQQKQNNYKNNNVDSLKVFNVKAKEIINKKTPVKQQPQQNNQQIQNKGTSTPSNPFLKNQSEICNINSNKQQLVQQSINNIDKKTTQKSPKYVNTKLQEQKTPNGNNNKNYKMQEDQENIIDKEINFNQFNENENEKIDIKFKTKKIKKIDSELSKTPKISQFFKKI